MGNVEQLGNLLKDLNKSFGENKVVQVGNVTRPVIEFNPTGLLSLDMALGGGFPEGRIIEIYGKESSGKAQPLTSKILTPTGWINMGDIEIGTVVSTPDGDSSTVLGIFPQGEQDVYEITFDDKTSVRCTSDHLWYVTIDGKEEVLSLEHIIPKVEDGCFISSIEPTAFSPKPLDVDPFQFGKSLIIKDSVDNEDIPSINNCLFNSFENRIIFLNGLEETNHSDFTTINKKLSETYEELMRSLGAKVITSIEDGKYVSVVQKETSRRIESIELVGKEECQCIYIAHPDHLYITDNYTPTHNTSASLMAIAEAQKDGKLCAFIDVEQALDFEYAQMLGVNVDDLIVTQPDNGEEALEILDRLINSSMFSIIVFDSVAAIVPKAELEGNMGDQKMGVVARLMAQAMRKITPGAAKTKTSVIFINQTREKLGMVFGNPEVTTGGNALKFACSQRIEISKGTTLKDGEEVKGYLMKAKVVKNKVAPPFKKAEVENIFGLGFDKIKDVLNLAVERDIIQKGGSWYSYKDTKLGQGLENVKNLLADNPELLEEIEEKVKQSKK